MGYLIGGRFLIPGTDQNFREAKSLQRQGEVVLPSYKPSSGKIGRNPGGREVTAAGYTDYTRNAPLFNDPRYTSSTLAIPTDLTFNGLREKSRLNNLAICGNILRARSTRNSKNLLDWTIRREVVIDPSETTRRASQSRW